MTVQKLKDFTGGLDLNEPTLIEDNSFSVLQNMFYNEKNQLQTRRGYQAIFDSVGSDPFTSFFNYRNDETNKYVTVGFAGSSLYALDDNGERQSVKSDLYPTEIIPERDGARVRLDFAPYKGVLYMGDGVNPYAKYDGTTYSQIGVGTAQACTFTNATNLINDASHGLSEDTRIVFSGTGTLPAEIEKNRVYLVTDTTTDAFKIKPFKGGDVISFTDDGTGSLQYQALSQPRMRYIQYLADRLYGSGDDETPQTLYYTAATPSDGDSIGSNAVIIGGDEGGVVSGITQLEQIVIVTKTNKIHAVNVAAPSVDAIDAQGGAYSNRVINNVENGLFIYTDRGVDQLRSRDGVSGSSAIRSSSLSEKVRDIFDQVTKNNYKYSCGLFIPELNHFYVSVDADNNTVPETTLVWNAKTQSWSEYLYPNLYTFGRYQTAKDNKYIFAPAAGGQLFEMEKGFDDNGSPIETKLETKNFDFDDPVQLKTFEFVDISGYKQEGGEVSVIVEIDGEDITEGIIGDSNIDTATTLGGIGITPIGVETIGDLSTDEDDELRLYPFNVRIPFYNRGSTIKVKITASGVQWILTQMRIDVNAEPVEVFNYGDIL